MAKMLDEMKKLLKSEAKIIRDFITAPKGIFETTNEMTRTARTTFHTIRRELTGKIKRS